MAKDPTQRESIAGGAHGGEGDRLSLLFNYVEVALLKVSGHARDVCETP